MHILHVIPYMHPSAGGPPVVVEKLIKAMNESGHRSRIFTTTAFCRSDEEQLLRSLNKVALVDMVDHRGVWIDPRLRIKIEAAIAWADIVHIHTLWSPLNWHARRSCVRFGRPYVIMPHGMLDPYSMSVRGVRKRIYLKLVEEQNVRGADRIIFTSSEEARLATLSIAELPKSIVVPLGGDYVDDDIDGLKEAFYARFETLRGRRVILFLGRLHFKKGLDRIIDILPSIVGEFPNLMLLVVGAGAGAYERQLRNDVATRRLDNYVLFTGHLDGRDKWGAFACSDLFLLPSRQENFAVAVAEAMQIGVPVVISDKVNLWPHVQDAKAGLVVHEENIKSELEGAIRMVLGDRVLARAMAESGRDYARQNLNWKATAQNMYLGYKEVLDEHGSKTEPLLK